MIRSKRKSPKRRSRRKSSKRKSSKRRSRRKSSKRRSRRKSPKRRSRRKSPKRRSRRKSPGIILSNSNRKEKKFMVVINNKTIHFGAKGYSDYTKHKDSERKKRYINRHKKRENWTKSGIKTAGFWSRWLLWGEPTLRKSIKKIEDKFNVIISRKR